MTPEIETIQRRIREAMVIINGTGLVKTLREADYAVEVIARDTEGLITLTVEIGAFAPSSDSVDPDNREGSR
jgi:hypothetical protein